MIHIEHYNTVKSLRDKLQALMMLGNEDGGFPIVRHDGHGSRLVGYIGASELEHALSESFRRSKYLHRRRANNILGIVADSAEATVAFHPMSPSYHHRTNAMTSYITTVLETGSLLEAENIDPFDFSYYMDQVNAVGQPRDECTLTGKFT